jgi:hypothetical protein
MTNLNRTEKVIAGVAFGAIAVFIFMFFQISKNSGSKLSSQFESAHSINYKMARPEQVYSEYTLNGRELDTTYEALTPEEKKAVIKKKAALVAKKKAAIKKDELKKKQVAAAAAKAKTLAKTRAQQLAAAREARLQTAEMKRVNSAPVQQAPAYTGQNYNNQTAAAPAAEETDPKLPAKKSFAQWRALLFDKPTTETLTAFITAFRKNEVTMTEYQAMAQDLLDQSDDKLKALGLQALRSVPSFQSYSQLVHIQPSLPANLQTYVNASLAAYLQPQNLGYLNQALASSDKVVLLKALVMLNDSLTRLAEGDASAFSDPRSRGATGTSVTMSNFRNLLPALGQLRNSQDQELAPLAQNVMNLISQSNNVALN